MDKVSEGAWEKERVQVTRWSATLSSKVYLSHAINVRASGGVQI